MQYQAICYDGLSIVQIIEAKTIEQLKEKCSLSMYRDDISTIVVAEVKDIGYLKVPNGLEKALQRKMI